jgi:hypothetical protein
MSGAPKTLGEVFKATPDPVSVVIKALPSHQRSLPIEEGNIERKRWAVILMLHEGTKH